VRKLQKKSITAIAIFILMFAFAWWTNGINDRYYHVDTDIDEEGFELLKVDDQGQYNGYIQLEPFKPREYIRVQNRYDLVHVE